MTRQDAIDLMVAYSEAIKRKGPMYPSPILHHAMGMHARFPADGSENKAMRWLGWIQGVLCASHIYTLDEVKEHSRTKCVPEVP